MIPNFFPQWSNAYFIPILPEASSSPEMMQSFLSMQCSFPITIDRKTPVGFVNIQRDRPELYHSYFRDETYDYLATLGCERLNHFLKELKTHFQKPGKVDLDLCTLPPQFLGLLMSYYLDHHELYQLDLKKARVLVDLALKQASEDPFLKGVNGWLYFCEGNTEAALDKLNDAIRLDEKNPYLLARRGVIMFYLNDLESALKDLEDAEEFAPNDPFILSHKAVIYLKIDMDEEAKELLENVSDLNPEFSFCDLVQAQLFTLETKLMSAYKKIFELNKKANGLLVMEWYKKIREKIDTNPITRIQLLIHNREYFNARRECQKFLKTVPRRKYHIALTLYAEILSQLGLSYLALQNVKKALRMSKDYKPAIKVCAGIGAPKKPILKQTISKRVPLN